MKNKNTLSGAIWGAALLLMCALATGQATAPPNDYKLGADDLVSISVFDHPELSVVARVSNAGNITFPLLGVVPVAGLSTHQLEDTLATRLNDGAFIKHPQVSVLVTEYQSQKVSVLGEVMRPGQYMLTTQNRVLDLIAQAGGLVTSVSGAAPNAISGDTATLMRHDGQKTTIDLHALFNGDASQNVPVSGGDTLVVPPAPLFYIYGQVQKPGPYKLERGMTVTQAIVAGGGLTPKGSEHWMKVKRRDANGKIETLSVKGRDTLQPDDVLSIPEGWF